MGLAFFICILPIPNRRVVLQSIKFSVAPLSTRAPSAALCRTVEKVNGTCIAFLFFNKYDTFGRTARNHAAGFEPSKNPVHKAIR
jgi:hypothetical protein